jgi:hypothetical protein
MYMVYALCKAKIEQKRYESKEKMQEMLDVFYAGDRLTTEEYQELSLLLAEQE